MKKILSLLAMLFISGIVLADGIKFTESNEFKKLVAQAKKENKLIFLDAYATWCGPCKYLQSDVFTQKEVGDFFNANYINAKIDMEKGEGPALAEEFGVTAYPTLFFINGDGKVLHKYVGSLKPDALIDLGKNAANPDKQYYTLREKAEAGTLTPKVFHDWVHDAEKMEDEDVKDVIAAYLEKTNYPLMERQMLDIVFEHASRIPERLLKTVISNKAEIMVMNKYTEDDFKAEITAKAISLALEDSYKNDVLDLNMFKTIVARYSPENANLETKKMQIKYLFVKRQDEQAIKELVALMEDKSLKLPVSSMASLIYDRAERIVKAKRGDELINKIKAFKVQKEEIKGEIFKDFALLCIYYKMDNKDKVVELKAKLRANSNITEALEDAMDDMDEGDY